MPFGQDCRNLPGGQFFADFHVCLDTEGRTDFIQELGNPWQDLPPELVSVYPPE